AETGSPWKLVSEGGEWIPTRAQAIPSPHPIGTEPLAIEGRGSRSRDREQACARQEAQVHRRREVADRARGRRVHRARGRRGASATGGDLQLAVTAWRKQLALHGSEGLAQRAPGRKPKLDAKDRRILELEKRTARLEAKLELADKLIALQKKASELLGIELASDDES